MARSVTGMLIAPVPHLGGSSSTGTGAVTPGAFGEHNYEVFDPLNV